MWSLMFSLIFAMIFYEFQYRQYDFNVFLSMIFLWITIERRLDCLESIETFDFMIALQT